MTSRSKRSTVVFRHAAKLNGLDVELPAGTYSIDVDEEQIPNLSFVAYRRVQTTIEVPIEGGANVGRQVLVIDPHALEAALQRDAATMDDITEP